MLAHPRGALTGRNHHTCATGAIMEFGTGYPGYNTLLPKSCCTVGEILKQNGYNTSFYGKCHNVPDWHTSQAGPFDRWPINQGFEYFYGFFGAATSQWDPEIMEGSKPIQKPRGDKDYHFDRDMADHAIAWIRQQHSLAPKKPFLVYYAPGTSHVPHHVPKEWISRFHGRFDQGWDKVREETFQRQKRLGVIPANAVLTPRPKEIPAWDSLSGDRKKLYAHMMEVYCAALAHCDHHIGRIIDALEQSGQLDNTLVLYIQGDNGPSAEGTLQGLTDELGVGANGVPETLDYLLSVMNELGGPKILQSLSGGLEPRHGHAFPVDEAGRLAFWRHPQRPGDLLAQTHQGRGRPPPAVPSRHRRPADDPRSRRIAGAGHRQRRGPKTDRGRQHAVQL